VKTLLKKLLNRERNSKGTSTSSTSTSIAYETIIFIAYLVISSGMIGFIMIDHLNQNQETWEINIRYNIESQEYLLSNYLNNSFISLALLEKSKEMAEILAIQENNPVYDEMLTDVKSLFTNYSHQYLQFTQIRYINETGFEKVRIVIMEQRRAFMQSSICKINPIATIFRIVCYYRKVRSIHLPSI